MECESVMVRILGIIYIYLSKPELKTVKISPTPDNCEQTLYKDKANICYQYDILQ